jgi:hypothetical protein
MRVERQVNLDRHVRRAVYPNDPRPHNIWRLVLNDDSGDEKSDDQL